MNISTMHCQPCHNGVQSLTDKELTTWLGQLDRWQLVTDNGINKLQQTFTFGNYSQSMAFANAVAQQADKENHHPLMIIEYSQVTVIWWTHTIHGLHENDFILAARTSLVAKT